MYTFNYISKIPEEWIYNHYLNIEGNYNGTTIKVKSPFTDERTPSFCIYKKNNEFLFNDFSSALGGNCLVLVKNLLELKKNRILSLAEVETDINKNYENYKRLNGEYKREHVNLNLNLYNWICNYNLKTFGKIDQQYWYDKYNISEEILTLFKVKVLEGFKLSKKYNNGYVKHLSDVFGPNIYAYFSKNNTINTIYQPNNNLYKFIKLYSVIYGEDNLSENSEILIIGSSNKDIMCMYSLGINKVDFIASPNENVLIKKDKLDIYKKKYNYIFTLLDNDKTGIKTMSKYKELYNIPFIYCPYEKDFSDSMEKYKVEKMYEFLLIQLNKKINE